jgi:hypothetical protein
MSKQHQIKPNKTTTYNPNAPETEEDGLLAGKLRILKVQHLFKELRGENHSLLPLPETMQQKMKAIPKDNKNMSK